MQKSIIESSYNNYALDEIKKRMKIVELTNAKKELIESVNDIQKEIDKLEKQTSVISGAKAALEMLLKQCENESNENENESLQ